MLRFSTVLLSFALSVTFAAADWYKPYKKGKQALEKGDWSQAIEKLKTAIAADPEPNERKRIEGVFYTEYFPYFYLALASLRLCDVDAAREHFEQARGTLPRKSDKQYVPGQPAPSRSSLEKLVRELEKRIGQFDDHRTEAEKALQDKCYDAVGEHLQGAKSVDSCRFEQLGLETQLNQATLLAQQSRDLAREGSSLEKQAKLSRAKQLFSRGSDQFPCELVFAEGLSRIQQREDQYAGSKQRADSDLSACRFADARSHYEDASARHTEFTERDNLRLQVDLINALEGLETALTQAEAAYQRSDYQEASARSAEVLDWGKDHSDPPQCYRPISGRATVVRDRSRSQLLYLEAVNLLEAGEYERAERALRESLRLDPEHTEARRPLETSQDFGRRYDVAMDRCQRGQYERCRQLLLEVKELDPDRFRRVGGEGRLQDCRQEQDQERAVELLLDYGQIDSSITLLQRLAQDRKSDPDPPALLGVAYAYKGFLESGEARDQKIGKAKEQFRRALALQKTYTLRWDLPPHIVKIFREATSESKKR